MLDKFKLHLKSHNFSVTPARLAVFKYLRTHDRAPVQAIIRSLSEHFDQASVYRTVALFKELGIAQESISGGQKLVELTDAFDSHHHHISCTQCGHSVTIEDPALEQLLGQLALQNGVTPLSHQIEITGLCQKCAPKGTIIP